MVRIFPSVDTPEAARAVARYAGFAALGLVGCSLLVRLLPVSLALRTHDRDAFDSFLPELIVVALIFTALGAAGAGRLWAGKGAGIAALLAAMGGFARVE